MSLDILVCPATQGDHPGLHTLIAALQQRFGAAHICELRDKVTHGQLIAMVDAIAALFFVVDPPYEDADLSTATPLSQWSDQTLAAASLAHEQKKLVIPILLDGASMPHPATLPPELAFVSQQESLVVHTDVRVYQDVKQVAHHLAIQLSSEDTAYAMVFVEVAMVAVLVISVFVIAFTGMWRSVQSNLTLFILLVILLLCGPPLFLGAFELIQFARQRQWRLLLAVVVSLLGISGALWAATQAAEHVINADACPTGSVCLNTIVGAPLVPLVATVLPIAFIFAVGVVGLLVVPFLFYLSMVRAVSYRRRRGESQPERSANIRKDGIFSVFFLSYRRADSQAMCDRIYAYLAQHYRRGKVFRDINSLLAGAQWTTILSRAIAGCETMLVVIGPHWLSATDASGQRRLDNADDMVRFEVTRALEIGTTVVPVLVDGATLPLPEDLPPPMRALATLRPVVVHDGESFNQDMRRLVRYHRALHPVADHQVLLWSIRGAMYGFLAGILYLIVFDPIALVGYVASLLSICYDAQGTLQAICTVPYEPAALHPFLALEGAAAILFVTTWGWTLAGLLKNGQWKRARSLCILIVLSGLAVMYLLTHLPIGLTSPLRVPQLLCVSALLVLLVSAYGLVTNYARGVVAAWVESRSQRALST